MLRLSLCGVSGLHLCQHVYQGTKALGLITQSLSNGGSKWHALQTELQRLAVHHSNPFTSAVLAGWWLAQMLANTCGTVTFPLRLREEVMPACLSRRGCGELTEVQMVSAMCALTLPAVAVDMQVLQLHASRSADNVTGIIPCMCAYGHSTVC